MFNYVYVSALCRLIARFGRSHYSPYAASALVVYDTSLTLSDEIQYIWSRKPRMGTILYILARYFGALGLFVGVAFGVETEQGLSKVCYDGGTHWYLDLSSDC